MEKKQKFEMDVNGETIVWEEKSHAQIFRNFWAYFMEKDLQKTIDKIEQAGIRTSDNEYFVSINGSKKKNIFVKEGYYIYTHLTPSAMQKTYEKFLNGWQELNEGSHANSVEDQENEEAPPQVEGNLPLKNIYKKSLAMALVRAGNDLHHTMRNRENPKYQVYCFPHTKKLDRDIAELTGYKYEERAE
ncbi:hypothetical protein [Cytobacillus gottheilii]|uniref:hypothetical protein n=1 Tax=Cytobacillus gottheilii TaxID=859144 RepID=UPI0021486CD3|nr:hypothetical protein [Cytobacillus gottheilii]